MKCTTSCIVGQFFEKPSEGLETIVSYPFLERKCSATPFLNVLETMTFFTVIPIYLNFEDSENLVLCTNQSIFVLSRWNHISWLPTKKAHVCIPYACVHKVLIGTHKDI